MDSNDSNPKPKKKYVKKQDGKAKQKDTQVGNDKKQVKKQKQQIPQKDQTKPSQSFKVPSENNKFKKKEETKDNYIQSIKDLIDQKYSKKLKKYLIEVYETATKIVIKYDKTTPNIIFQFQFQEKPHKLLLKDLMKANESIKKNKQIIKQIYNALYYKIQQNFYQIGYFGIQVCQKSRILFRDRNFRNKKMKQNALEYQFYYTTKQQKIYFVMFDSILNSIQFSTDDIIKYSKIYPLAFNKYKQFQQTILKDTKVQEQMNENFGQEEVDSDEEGRAKKIANQKDLTISELKQKIQKLLSRDIEQFQQKIDRKDEQVQKYHDSNSQQVKKMMEKLADQVMQEQVSLDNFIETRDYVINKIRQKYADSKQEIKVLKSCLKRLILAQKQLASRLPIISRKREIFQKLNKNDLLILEGETGSGKSTQLPQLLCEYYKIFQNDNALPVLITQPRKLATRTLAERVALEMEEKIHGFVDYQTSLTTKINQKAKIVFKMDRLVLDQLREDPKLSKYCCLVIDEAHQRTISIDVILGLIKKLLTLRNDFKIIVTSASMDTDLFKKYYKTQILKVSGRMFPVKEIFQPYEHEKDKVSKIKRVINQKLLDDHQRNLRPEYRGHVLVFCSGIDQINELTTYFGNKLNPILFKVHALHGKLSPEEQKEVFADTKQFKIIFSSRIAETSITIDKVKVVIDPGQDRQLVYDQKTKVTALKLKNISQSSAKQRAGRAGRTNEGFCFRLYSKKQKSEFSSNKTPEMQNMALDTVVLRLKSLDIQDIINFPYLSAPSKTGLQNSIQVMKMLNCLDFKTQNITTIGDFLVKIPIEPFLARAIVQAMLMQKVLRKKKNILDVLNLNQEEKYKLMNIDITQQVIDILCLVVNASNIFYIRPEDRERAQRTKYQKLSDKDGDFFFLQNIYKQFINYSSMSFNQMKKWAYEHFLSLKTLKQVRQLNKQIMQIIKQFSIDQQALLNQLLQAQVKILKAKNVRQIILSCLVSSFATNLALYSQNQHIGYTIISLQMPTQMYGTSTLSLQGITPKWILFYDLYQNQKGQMYCKIANSIDFEFLKTHTNKYILKKFKILQAEKSNPYYEKISMQVPSLVFLNILNDYQRRNFDDLKTISFLQNYSINFYEDRNQIEFFYRINNVQSGVRASSNYVLNQLNSLMRKFLPLQNFRESNNPQQIIVGYLKQIQSKFKIPLKHNYVGPIYIGLEKGFQLVNIDFRVIQHVYKVHAEAEFGQSIYYYCHVFGTCQIFNQYLIFKITQQQDKNHFEKTLNALIQNFRLQYKKIIKYTHQLQDRRKKIPQSKLFMHFWAGSREKDNILLSYANNPKLKERDNFIGQMLDCLNSKKLKGQQNRLLSLSFNSTKRGDAINCFNRRGDIDQYELHEILQQCQKNKNLNYGFEMPSSFKMFRQPDLQLASKSQKQWEDQIILLLKGQGIDLKNIAIKVWGRPFHPKNKNVSQFERNLKVQWSAQIKSYDLNQLKKFKQKYDKKTNVIGTQKVHLKFEFEHTAIVTTLKAFNALSDQFNDQVQTTKAENPRVTVDYFQKTFKKMTKVFIKIRGQNRDQLIRPSLRFISLFTPKLVPLNEKQFRFLEMEKGNQILEQLQQQYQFKIYFAFQRKNLSLKVYCYLGQLDQITKKLFNRFKQFTIFQQQIDYRGKNLNKVQQVIKNKIQQINVSINQKRFLNYKILFKFRKVRLTGDLDSCDQVKNQIMKIVSKPKSGCDICAGLIQKPYKLYVCKHQYCWVCLSSYIRQAISCGNKDLINCPGCKQLISVYDIQKIMSQEEFNKLCDIQISKFVQKNDKYHPCFSPGCQNIFIRAQTQRTNSFECELCGKWYCFKCKQSHIGYVNCQDWKNKLLNNSQLQKLGIKKCPKCGQGIQKDKGCQHISCKCGTHICWNCLKTFKTSGQCYDHLSKKCGGIFLPRQQN